jgi:serine/threonine-protein kinase HipA
MALNEVDATGSLDTCMSVASYCGLTSSDARSIVSDVVGSVSSWKREAESVGLARADIERMESAFTHEDFKNALTLAGSRGRDLPKGSSVRKRTRSPRAATTQT